MDSKSFYILTLLAAVILRTVVAVSNTTGLHDETAIATATATASATATIANAATAQALKNNSVAASVTTAINATLAANTSTAQSSETAIIQAASLTSAITSSATAAITLNDTTSVEMSAISLSSAEIADSDANTNATNLSHKHANNSLNDDDDEEEDDLHLSSDSLTKGFSIPTFLPPFPEFAVADLPNYITTTLPPTIADNDIFQGEDQIYLDAYNKQLSRRNLTRHSTNITVQMGNHAYLPCNIRRISNKPVSWVRVRDGHILTVDQTTFIADQRFQSIYKEEDNFTWSLQIKYVQQNDEGWYECQVAVESKMSAKVYLSVVVPTTELIGDQNRFVKAGSKVALHCIIRGTLDPPSYIIWFKGQSQVTDDNKSGWYTEIDRHIFGNATDNQNTIGSLIIPFVRKKDSGNYTCQPSNSASVSVDLHVLSGEYSASAIMSAASTYCPNIYYLLLILLLVALQKT